MSRKKISKSHRLDWLPFESWLIPDIFSFSHVKGLARIFLIVEMSIAVLVVFGTFLVATARVVSSFFL